MDRKLLNNLPICVWSSAGSRQLQSNRFDVERAETGSGNGRDMLQDLRMTDRP